MTASLVSVRDLRIDFLTEAGRTHVIDHVNLEIAPGEIVGLVGESGSGKTTLARAILGILPPNARVEAGSIRFADRDLLAAPPDVLAREVRGRQITFVPQDPFTSFNPVFTIGSQMLEIMRWKSPAADAATTSTWSRYPRARRRADRERLLALLRTVQLPDPETILAKYPHQVSGGQRQRLMIAMALATEPRLIIADEPTTALDVTIQAQILKLIRTLARDRGVSVLFATHDLGAAHEICDRIVVMYAGQEVEAAPADAFFASPRHPYTESLLASLPSRERGIRGIPGEIPSLLTPPPGCRFHPRCARADATCRAARPPVTTAGVGHTVRCVRPIVTTSEVRP